MEITKKKAKKPIFHSITPQYKEELFSYLLDNLDIKLTNNEILLLRKAYNTAFEAHKNQFRKISKEPYIIHPIEVALIVSNEMGLDFIAILSALLHDVLEDSDLFSYEYIKKEFGDAVALTVEGVTKMTRVGGKARADIKDNKINEKLETFKKLIFSISKEYRVILIKIADRLHNMRTMAGMPEAKQKAKSAENLYVYAKFAEAIGMYDIKIEMEDLSFKYLYPNEYKKIIDEVKKIQPYRDEYLEKLKIELYKILTQNTNYNFQIKRIKNSYYSLWEKLNNNRSLTVKQIYNFESLRIIVDIGDRELRDVVYNIFVKITDFYPLLNNSFRDWIRNPKPNGFRALVFDILYNHKKTSKYIPQLAQIQILSAEDEIVARKGANFERLKKSIVPQIGEDESITEFINRIIDQLKTEFIYVFTPAGEIYQLPKGATVIDFAFKVHTDIGLHCIGGKIQGIGSKSPTYRLNSGDVVEVLYSQNKKPEIEWLTKVITEKARKELTNYFKKKNILIESSTKSKLNFKFSSNLPLIIDGTFDFKIANCCNPLPGDDAVALQDEKGNIIIHSTNCSDLAFHISISPSSAAKVEWLIKEISYDITIKALDRIGLLKDIIDIISNNLQLNLTQIQMNIDKEEKLVNGFFTIKIQQNKNDYVKKSLCKTESEKDKKNCRSKQLHKLLTNLKKVNGIINVEVRIHHEK